MYKVFHLFLGSLRLLCGDTINAVCNRTALGIRLEDDVACTSPDSVFKDFTCDFEAERFGSFGLWQGRLIFICGDKRYAFCCGGEFLFFIDKDSSDVLRGKYAFEISDPCVSVHDVCHGGCTDGDKVKEQPDDEKRSEQPDYNGPCSG